MGHLVERAARIDGHAGIGQSVEHARAVHDGVEEHREGSEDDDRGDGDGGSADGAARRGHQRRIAVHLQQAAQQDAAQNGDHDDDQIDGDGRDADCRHLGQRQAESVEDDAPAEHLFRAEPDARDPCFGQFVAQAVGIEHAQHDADDQRTERKPSDDGEFGDVERREREQRDQKNSVERIRPVAFFQHILYSIMRDTITFSLPTGQRSHLLPGYKTKNRYPE